MYIGFVHDIGKISMTSPFVINVPTRALFAVKMKGCFVPLVGTDRMLVNRYHPYILQGATFFENNKQI